MTSEAIVIGVNHYDYLQPLKYAQQDALAVKNFLEQEARFDRVYYFAEDAPALNGMPMKPTLVNLRRVMRDTFAKPFMQDGDNFWFFFSGHGMRDGERDFLMPIDGDPGDVEGSGISTAQVSAWLRGCGADNVVMILDACRSGGSKDGKGIGDETREGCRQTGVISLFSCSPNQFSYELEAYQRGAFTKVLLEGLGIQGGCSTVARLDEYLKRQVPEIVRECLGDGVKQFPYSIAEPINKSHLILMPQYSRPEDLNALKMDAFRAEVGNDFRLALQCWLRVNIASRGSDSEAIDKIVELKPKLAQLSTVSKPTKPSEVPLFKGDLGGSSSPKPIDRLAVEDAIPLAPLKRGNRSGEGSQAIVYPTFKFEYATIDQNYKITKYPGEAHHFRETINGVDFELVQIPAGSFEMGSNQNDSEKPIHSVTVPEFFMGKYPVTQAQWKTIANLKQKNRTLNPDPSEFKGGDRPVENVFWEEAVEFCDRLSDNTGRLYRLPSEAEWEYACRAGTTTAYHFGETIYPSLANCDYDTKYFETTTVGKFPGNPWGLFDCHGNVWEWCADVWHPNHNYAPTDESPRITGANTEYHLGRGGCAVFPGDFARSASRFDFNGDPYLVGFRLVLSIVSGSPRPPKSPNSGGL
jgi:formylglycine-generating enzyme required for sulfatase activity/uncharacterized caspase-like protein